MTDDLPTPTESLVDKVRHAIGVLESGLATRDDALTAMNFVNRLKELTRELAEAVEAGVIECIRQHGEIVDGTVRYYVGVTKTTKCVDMNAAVQEVMNATGGDMDAFVACLSAGALKHGACSKVLPPDVYGKLFETREVCDIKTGVAKGEKLQKIDERFIK